MTWAALFEPTHRAYLFDADKLDIPVSPANPGASVPIFSLHGIDSFRVEKHRLPKVGILALVPNELTLENGKSIGLQPNHRNRPG